MTNKTCFDCTECMIDAGSPGYSEYTPGWEGDMYCRLSHWKYDAFNDEKAEMRTKFYMALTCPDFKAEQP